MKVAVPPTMITTAILVLAVTTSQSESRGVFNPSERILKLKQLYLEDQSGDLCEDNPVIGIECGVCDDMGLTSRSACCTDLIQFSGCQDQLVPYLREMSASANEIPVIADPFERDESAIKRYASTFARWGYSKGYSPVQWGRPITARKRYGMASGRRFNFNRFKQGGYNQAIRGGY